MESKSLKQIYSLTTCPVQKLIITHQFTTEECGTLQRIHTCIHTHRLVMGGGIVRGVRGAAALGAKCTVGLGSSCPPPSLAECSADLPWRGQAMKCHRIACPTAALNPAQALRGTWCSIYAVLCQSQGCAAEPHAVLAKALFPANLFWWGGGASAAVVRAPRWCSAPPPTRVSQ